MYSESDLTCRFSEGFEDNCSRLCFLRRVFLLLIFALLLMFAQLLVIELNGGINAFFVKFYWLAFIGLTVFLCTSLMLSCSNAARSCFPWNFLLFLVLVESLTIELMVLAVILHTKVILLTVGCQAFIFLALLFVAMAVPVDFTKWTALFLLVFLILFIFAVAMLINIYSLQLPVMEIVYSFVAVIVLSAATLLNVQVLFNGAIFELCSDDYILGAILMFADLVIFFMCCLNLIGFNTDC